MRPVLVADGSEGTATIEVWVDHPSWDRTFFESASGAGNTAEEAQAQAMLNVEIHAVHLIDHLGGEEPDERFETQWAGTEHRWAVWLGYVMTLGKNEAVETKSFWPLLREGVVARLGNQKVTYVKVTGAWFQSGIIAEVRVNNIVSAELTEVLRQHIESTWPENAGVMQKQLFWIAQDEGTYQPYPHRAEGMKNYVVQAGRIFHELCKQPGELDREEYEDRLGAAVGDKALTMEMVSLIPEIVTQQAYPDLPVSESITIVSGDVEYKVNIHQLASFAHLYAAVDATWCREVPEETISEWIGYSALGHGVRQLQDSGHELSAVNKPIELNYSVRDGYVIR